MNREERHDNSSVRRQDRLLQRQEAERVLREAEYGVLSMVEERNDGETGGYGVPLSVVWDGEGSIYFHCAREGHKLECLRRNPRVSLCVVGRTQVIPERFTTEYESVVVRGRACAGLSDEERMKVLEMIVEKYAPGFEESGKKMAGQSFGRTEIVRIDIETISSKTHVVR